MGIDRQEFYERYGYNPGRGGSAPSGGWVKIRSQNLSIRLSKIERALGSDGLKQLGDAGVSMAEEAMRMAFSTQTDPVSNRRWAQRRRRLHGAGAGKPLLRGLGAGASASYRVWRGKLRVSQLAPPGRWHSSRLSQAALLFIHKYGVKKRLHRGAVSGGTSRSAIRYLRETEGGEVDLPKRRSFGISRKKRLELRNLAIAIARESINR